MRLYHFFSTVQIAWRFNCPTGHRAPDCGAVAACPGFRFTGSLRTSQRIRVVNPFALRRGPLQVLLLFLLLSGVLYAGAQPANPIAQLKFEDAEKAFNAGQYEKAMDYIQQTEKLAGVTSKTLYLKIVTEEKMVAAGMGPADLPANLKTHVKTYLKALEEQPIDDKYRNVYEISKKLEAYSGSALAGSTSSYGAAGSPAGHGARSARTIVSAYKSAVRGSLVPGSVRCLKIESAMSVNGQPAGRITVQKALHKMVIITNAAGMDSKIVYNNGRAYTAIAGRKIPLPDTQGLARQVDSPESLIAVEADLENLEGASVQSGELDGEPVDIVINGKSTYLFSKNTHLLLKEQQRGPGEVMVITLYKDYTNYSGFLLPATTITETRVAGIAAGTGGREAAAPGSDLVAVASKATQVTASDNSGEAGAALPATGLVAGSQNSGGKDEGMAIGLLGARRKKRGRIRAGAALNARPVNSGRDGQTKLSADLQALIEAFAVGGQDNKISTTRIISVQLNGPVHEEDFQ